MRYESGGSLREGSDSISCRTSETEKILHEMPACMLSGFGGLGHTVVATCCVASMLVANF